MMVRVCQIQGHAMAFEAPVPPAIAEIPEGSPLVLLPAMLVAIPVAAVAAVLRAGLEVGRAATRIRLASASE